jgi:hypothetical protein
LFLWYQLPIKYPLLPESFFMAKVTEHSGKITIILLFILLITRFLGDYFSHYIFVTGISIPNNKDISSTGSVGPTPNTT